MQQQPQHQERAAQAEEATSSSSSSSSAGTVRSEECVEEILRLEEDALKSVLSSSWSSSSSVGGFTSSSSASQHQLAPTLTTILENPATRIEVWYQSSSRVRLLLVWKNKVVCVARHPEAHRSHLATQLITEIPGWKSTSGNGNSTSTSTSPRAFADTQQEDEQLDANGGDDADLAAEEEDERASGDDDEEEQENREEITDAKWLHAQFICVGYSTGFVRVFDSETRRLVYEQKLHTACVKNLSIHASFLNPSTSLHHDQSRSQTTHDAGKSLWILYTDATVVMVQLSDVLHGGSSQASKFRKYSLRDQSQVLAAIPCGSVRPSVFQSHARLGVYSIVSVGSDPFVAFYQAGNDQNSIVHLAHLATAIASRAAGAVWSFATSWRWGSTQDSNDGDASGSSARDATASSTMVSANSAAVAEHVAAPLTANRWMPEDTRRRVRMCSVSPTGRLALIADTLGRVLLVDTWRMTIIRLWKGYRNAQCGWMHGREGLRSRQGLYMVVYSEQRGIVEIWRARFGPRVFTLPVGQNARIFTHVDSITRKAKCLLLAKRDNGRVTLCEINSHAPNSTVLMKYFTQNKLQEENFVLHQILGALRTLVKKKSHHSNRRRSSRDNQHQQSHKKASTHSSKRFGISGSEPLTASGEILAQMASLSSPTTVQTLVEVLFQVEMETLEEDFLLKCVDTLLETLRSSLSSHAPSGSELSTLWQLLWKRCLIATYIGLRKEFDSCYGMVQARMKSTDRGDSLEVGESSSFLLRLRAWMELYRRAGMDSNEEKKMNEFFLTSCQNANRMTCLEFLRFFAMPFEDPVVLSNRELLSHFTSVLQQHQAMKPEIGHVFLKKAFESLNISVLKPSMAPSMKQTFMTFAFTPVLSSVFAVEEIAKLHEQMLLAPLDHVNLFVEWFFSLPLDLLVSLPAPSSSSSLQRWLKPLITSLDTQEAIEASQQDSEANEYEAVANQRQSLPLMAERLGEVFQVCCKNVQLFHGFLLAVHCEWGEKQHAKQLEEHTLGEFSAEAAGMRWRILQDCISKTVHLSLRLGKAGRLSVQAAESVDEIMRTIALMKLNDEAEPKAEPNHDPQQESVEQCMRNNVASSTQASPSPTTMANEDAWISSMETCRNARQMRALSSVAKWFPRFFDADALNCFQIVILCAAWNAERSEMHQLDEAVGLISWIRNSKIRAAMANLVWEKYLRVHVVTLVSFWEENVTGKKTKKGLQPQIARHLFSIIRRLLKEFLMAVHDLKLKPLVHDPSPRDRSIGSSDANGENDRSSDDDGEEDDDEEDDKDGEENEQESVVSLLRSKKNLKATEEEALMWTMETLLKRNLWHHRVQRLPQLFNKHWPPSHTQSLLWRILDGFDGDSISVQQMQDHLSLVLLLDAFAATPLVPVSITRLFFNKGAQLCRPNTFALIATEEKERATNHKENSVLQQQRTKLLYQLLRLDVGACYELAESFGYPLEPFRDSYVVFLYQMGDDAMADDAFDKMQPPHDLQLVPQMVAIARARLAVIFERMQLAPEFAPIMCLVPADTLRWISSDSPPFERDREVVKVDPAPSLTNTSVLLAKCVQFFAPESIEHKKISEMLVLVKNVATQLSGRAI